MLRSYDAQIGRFLQHDPYDEFASGYIGMGNDPANLTDPSGGCATCWEWIQKAVESMGTLQPVTVIGQKKTLVNTAVGVSTIITKEGQRIGAQIINQAKPGLLRQVWNYIKGVGPLIGRGASVIGGVLIPTPTGEGASFTPEQMYERIYPNPEHASDDYLAEAEKRMNAGNALPNDWRLVAEIQRRKTARESAKLPRYEGPKPKYQVNEKHVKLRKGQDATKLPDDAEEVYKNAVPDDPIKPKHWYGRNKDGAIYRYSSSNDGNAHFSGRSDQGSGIHPSDYAKKRLSEN